MIGCLQTCVRKQPIIRLYFELENELKIYNLKAWLLMILVTFCMLLAFVSKCRGRNCLRMECSFKFETFAYIARIA